MDTKKNKIKQKIEFLQVGESFKKKEFVKSIWGERDYFVDRSFDVLLNSAKKELPEMEFKTIKGFVTRIK